MLFCAVFIYRYFWAVLRFSYVILYGVYTGISVRFCGVRTLLTPPPFRISSDLKFYYMHVKASCKGIDTETDVSVLIHATLISST